MFDGIPIVGMMVAFGIACAAVGWAVIEGIIWLASHISIAWG